MDTVNLALGGSSPPPAGTAAESLAPGTLLLDRYLVGWLLGQGAMGEVYRAQDLKLGEPVALKFLTSRDPRDVELLLREARLSRRISHPHVCRVFDVGEAQGRPFISMEYIDGEDLASLLRRIGRLPPDKALHVAHQLCAGLQAAHERGILHRDLKPANIMLDGTGQVRITDFGLAVRGEDLRTGAALAGTPVYMAPEQLRGGQCSVRSDLYALGLILYELFTGQGVYRPQTLAELRRLQEQPPPSPAALVPDLSPQIDRAILWCLEPDPARRPESAAALAQALPGGSMLTAALRAGQTPSPQQVAAAGDRGALRPALALGLGAATAAVLALAMVLGGQASLLPHLPLHKPAVVLADRAENLLERLGYPAPPYRAFGFSLQEGYLAQIERRDASVNRWQRLRHARPAAVDFWYRGWHRPLVSGRSDGRVDLREPPPIEPGMVSIRLDPLGRLRELLLIPTSLEGDPEAVRAPVGKLPGQSPPRTPDWDALFAAAGLDRSTFRAVPADRVPPVFVDERAAWIGADPERPQERLRVEAGALLGQPVSFRVGELDWPPVPPTVVRPWRQGGADLLRGLLAVVSLCGAVVLAWHNLRRRCGDRTGALRVALITMTLSLLGFALRADHAPDLRAEAHLLLRGLSESLLQAGWLWLFYIALEPYVRRLWPETLISWSRLLAGQWRDALVWRALLVGALSGCLGAVFFFLNRLTPGWLGQPPPVPWIREPAGVEALAGGMVAAGHVASGLVDAARFALSWLMVLVLCKLLLQRRLLAALCCGAVMWATMVLREMTGPLSLLLFLCLTLTCLGCMVRFGVLALLGGKVVFDLLTTFPMFLPIERSYATLMVLHTGALMCALVLASVGSAGWLTAKSEEM
ncbi:MAG: serine/threonine-protein kinase [Myxococcales bacterium]|nr:serine/threonine protein kinase [Myxococcota bacterium]MDW8280683.1 serine/threonine-protein kinase [Myxococcales bacterium]